MKKFLFPFITLTVATFNVNAQTSLTTDQGEVEVKKNGETVFISKATNSPQVNTIIKTSIRPKEPEAKEPEAKEPEVKEDLRYQANAMLSELSDNDLEYIKVVNMNEKINTIESKVANKEVLTKEELRILRQKNPEY